MKTIERGFTFFKDKARCEIVDNYCPYEMDNMLDDMDLDTYEFVDENTERGCRGITCEQCWDKELN